MKKYNEEAIKLYEIAKDSGLEDIAESIKTMYKVKREKQSKPIKEWLDASDYVPSSFYQRIRNIRRNEITPYTFFTTEKEQKEINNIKKEFDDVIRHNAFKNGDTIVATKNEACRAKAWDHDFFTKITTDELALQYSLFEVFRLGGETEDAKTWSFNEDTEVWMKD